MKKFLLSIASFGLICSSGYAQTTVELSPEKDNSIYSESTNSNGIGRLYSGITCTGNTRRALIEFDISDIVPAGATITAVSLHLNLDKVSPGAGTQAYSLHRVTTEWGEGTSFGSGGGASPVVPDATWVNAMHFTEAWDDLGGDFISDATATTDVGEVLTDYTWSSDQMVYHVQNWLNNPSSNHGWILLGDEESTCNARRFGSKDDGVAPILEITYECADENPVAICQSQTVFLDDLGAGTLSPEDLDGGSFAVCEGDLTYEASVTEFSCEDITTYEDEPSLVLSAVFDGPLTGGTPKGVEVYVINDIEDLSRYGIGFANNGGGSDGIEFTFPAVSASAGEYLYVATENGNFFEWFGFESDYLDGDAAINGDDAIELFMDGEVIDVFGDIDEDGSGTPWDYLDGWAKRISETGPDGASFNIDNWTFSGINEWDGELNNLTAASPLDVKTFVTAPTIGIPVELTITDESGLTATCYSPIFVIDNLPPVMNCAADFTVVLDATGTTTISADDLDAGTTDGCGIEGLELSVSDFTCEDAGENEVWLYAVDVYGNVDSCSTIITVDASEVLSIESVVSNNPSCSDSEDGSIDISVSGGSGEYIYDWDNDGVGDDDDMQDLSELLEGIYIVEVMDDMGCLASSEFELIAPDEIVIDLVLLSNEDCPGSSNGMIDVTVGGGTPDYVFEWTKIDDIDFNEVTEDIDGLTEGDYTIVVTDDAGCTQSMTYTVSVEEDFDLSVTIEDGITLVSAQEGATYQWLNCDLDYTPIDGANDQSYSPEEPGFYAVQITLGGLCVDTSECIIFGFDNIEEELISALVYPNPSQGFFNIELEGNTEKIWITIFDQNGRVILKDLMKNASAQIRLEGIESGIYTLWLQGEDALRIEKLVIKSE